MYTTLFPVHVGWILLRCIKWQKERFVIDSVFKVYIKQPPLSCVTGDAASVPEQYTV